MLDGGSLSLKYKVKVLDGFLLCLASLECPTTVPKEGEIIEEFPRR
jgi:hypothetical protein